MDNIAAIASRSPGSDRGRGRYLQSSSTASCGLHLAAAGMKDPFRIAIWLAAAMKNQLGRRLKSVTFKSRRNRPVERIAGILPVHNRRHALERFHDLLTCH